jgi:hypothetical protein
MKKKKADFTFLNQYGTVVPVFLGNGYNLRFIEYTGLNYLTHGNIWCTTGLFGRENEEKKIRLSQIYDAEWNGEPLRKYMKKPYLESLFGIKLTLEEQVDLKLLCGFYINVTSNSYHGIFDTLEFIKRHEEEIEKKHPEEWKKFRLLYMFL